MASAILSDIRRVMIVENRAIAALNSDDVKEQLVRLAAALTEQAKREPTMFQPDAFGQTEFQKAYIFTAAKIVLAALMPDALAMYQRGREEGVKRVGMVAGNA